MTPAPIKPMQQQQQQRRRQQQQPKTQYNSKNNNFISDIITKFETKTSTTTANNDHNKLSGTHTITPNDNNNFPFKMRKIFSASTAVRPLVQFEMHPRECDSDDQEIFYNSNGRSSSSRSGGVLTNINNGHYHKSQINSTIKFSKSNEKMKYGSKKFDKIFELISWLPLSLLSLTGMGVTCLVGAFIMPKAIIHMILYPGFRLLFGTLYPAYRSYKAVRTKNVKEYVSILCLY